MAPPATSTRGAQRIFLVHSNNFDEYIARMDEILYSIRHPLATGREPKKLTKEKEDSTWDRWETSTDTESVIRFKRDYFTSNAELSPSTFLRVQKWLNGLSHGFVTASSPVADLEQNISCSSSSTLGWADDGRAETKGKKNAPEDKDEDSLYKYALAIRPMGYWW